MGAEVAVRAGGHRLDRPGAGFGALLPNLKPGGPAFFTLALRAPALSASSLYAPAPYLRSIVNRSSPMWIDLLFLGGGLTGFALIAVAVSAAERL
jgi:hypothetical protein